MPIKDEVQLQRLLEQLKAKLAETVAETDSFVDPRVIAISEEMDRVIVQLQKLHLTHRKVQ